MSLSYNNVLKRLKEQRSYNALSQNEMAQIVHMTQSNYSKIELASRRFGFDELKYLCTSPIDVYYIYTGRKSHLHYTNFLYGCSYEELCSYLNIIYSFVLIRSRNETSNQWKKILERIRYVPLVIGNQNSQNIFLILRHSLNCNQKKMAEKLGVDIKKFRDLEKGRCLPDSELLLRLYDLFSIPPTMLLKDKNGMVSEIATVLEMMKEGCGDNIFVILKRIHEIR